MPPSSYKDTNPIMNSLISNYLSKAPPPNVNILRGRFQHMNLAGNKHPIHNTRVNSKCVPERQHDVLPGKRSAFEVNTPTIDPVTLEEIS